MSMRLMETYPHTHLFLSSRSLSMIAPVSELEENPVCFLHVRSVSLH
jgi:hypothetical protein